MIASATQYGSMVILRDQLGQQVGSLSISNGQLLGFSRDFVVIQFGNMITTMDENQRTLGTIPLDSSFRVQGINESGFSTRTGNMVFSYDKYCRQVGSYPV